LVFTSRDIQERKRLEEQLAHKVLHDSLTGLANRVLFADRMQHALTRISRSKEEIAVLFIDLDRFKGVNDSWGHAAGDDLLVKTSKRVLQCLRPSDTAARLSGDEFAVLLEDLQSPRQAIQVADRILEALREPFRFEDREMAMSASIGLTLGTCAETPDALLRDADLAMYVAKAEGRDRQEFFRPQMHIAALERVDLEADLRRALTEDQFVLHYQPVVDLVSGSITGVEALVRWRHPTKGLLPPAAFVPVAEETGLIVPLGGLVLRQACKQLAAWHQEHPSQSHLSVSVNISVKHLQQERLLSDVSSALEGSGLEPRYLIVEITESALMQDPEAAIALMDALKRRKVRLAVDDFGTGYSSLAYLGRLPVDILKIDRMFMKDVTESAAEGRLGHAIVKLGGSMSLHVVAEGIETAQQLQTLRKWGCPSGQGYLFAKPLDVTAMGHMLSEGKSLIGSAQPADIPNSEGEPSLTAR
jgi:diguanylate cyclase (GGDEF)-like protein